MQTRCNKCRRFMEESAAFEKIEDDLPNDKGELVHFAVYYCSASCWFGDDYIHPEILEIKSSVHGMMSVELDDCKEFNCAKIKFLRSVVCNNYMDSTHYKMKRNVNPFVQGFSENDGRILIEFWTDNREEVEKYVTYLNSLFNSKEFSDFIDFWDLKAE